MKRSSHARPLRCMIACVSFYFAAVLPTHLVQAQVPVLSVQESGQRRAFEFSSDELEVVVRGETRTGRLRQTLETKLQGSKVLEDGVSRVVLKLSTPYDKDRILAGTDAVRNAAPEAEVLPVLYQQGLPKDRWSRRIATAEILIHLYGDQQAAPLALQTGAAEILPTSISNVVRLRYANAFLALDASRQLSSQGVQVQPLFKRHLQRNAVELPTDQFFPDQWHLVNTGQQGGTPGVDINVLSVWPSNKGQGIVVGIVDDGLEITHPDLRDNCPPAASRSHYDFNDRDFDPSPVIANGDAHGTAVGGLVAARQSNGLIDPVTGRRLGVTGVAPEATLYGLRLIAGPSTDADVANALTWAPGGTGMDVCNNSWGFRLAQIGLVGLDVLGRAAQMEAATKGRNGRGQITVFSAGNGRFSQEDANRSTTSNSRYVICVAAVNATGTFSSYSSPGACMLIAAPGGGLGSFGAELRCTTTDVTGIGGYNPSPGNIPNNDYTNTFNGTSTAAPVTAGVAALMLKINPQLGWRDVKEIMAGTARRIDTTNPDWVMRPAIIVTNPDRNFNEAGFKFSHDYGAGLIDAAAAVTRAFTWKNLPTEVRQQQSIPEPVAGSVIPANGAALVRDYNFSGAAFPNLRVEQIEVEVNITHARRSDLEITITSPSGVTSFLARPHFPPFFDADYKDIVVDDSGQLVTRNGGWVFTTTRNWGENSQGLWRVQIRDTRANGVNGRLMASAVRLYGTQSGTQRVVFEQQRISVNEPIGAPVVQPLTIRRLGPSTGSFTVGYQTSLSSATVGSDFQAASGTVTFADGETSKQIDITILNDTEPEDIEAVNVVLIDLQGADVSFGGTTLATLNIVDSETNPVSIVATDPEAGETSTETTPNTGEFTITRGKVTAAPLSVYYRISGSAREGSLPTDDYLPLPAAGVLRVATIPAFETSTKVTITPINDGEIEGTESVIATLELDGTNYILGNPRSATVQIIDDDRSMLQILPSDDLASEGGVTPNLAGFQIRRTPSTSLPLAVTLDFGGTQILGVNYLLSYQDALGNTVTLNDPLITNIVEIAPGQETLNITLTPLDDNIYQATKTVDISLRPSTAYDFSFGFLTTTRINIVENDPFPDTRVPTVTLNTPRNGSRFLINDVITFSGSASDTAAAPHTPLVEKVLYRLNRGVWKLVPGLTPSNTVNWSFDLNPADMAAGFNTLDVQSFDDDGNPSKVVSSVFKRVQNRSLTVAVVGAGSVSGNLPTYEVGDVVKITAVPSTGNIFGGWSGTLPSAARSYSFVMPDQDVSLTANFAANPFVADTTGNYSGLIQAGQFNLETSGYLNLTLSPTGMATGKMTLSGVVYSLRGEFLSDGTISLNVPRKNTTPLTLNLAVDLNPSGTRSITGSVLSATFSAAVTANRSHYNKLTNPAPASVAKNYTIVMPPADPIGNLSQDPRGYGVGQVKIGTDGVVRFSGTLPDGTRAAFNQPLSKDNTWPLFLNLYRKKGVLLGNITIDNSPATSDMNGKFNWFKPLVTRDLYFPLGFNIEGGDLLGSIYTPPATGSPALTGYASMANNARVLLEEGSLLATINKTASYETNNTVTISVPGNDKLSVLMNAATGDLRGSFVHPVSGRRVSIRGVLFQKQEQGFGFFPGSSVQGVNPQTGRLLFRKP